MAEASNKDSPCNSLNIARRIFIRFCKSEKKKMTKRGLTGSEFV